MDPSSCGDHNCHCGGIVVCVKSHLIVSKVYVSPEIVFLLLSIKLNHCSFLICSYCCPTSSSDNLDLLFDKITSVNPFILSNLILLGDFNINFYSTSSCKTKLDVISDTFHLKQIVNAPTHLSHTDTPCTIDLVFLPSNIDAPSCSIFLLLLLLQTIYLFFSPFQCTNSVNSLPPPPPCKVWLYQLTDFESANALLCSIDWNELLLSSDPNASWAIFKERFLHIMTTNVSSKLLYPPTNSYLPWINHTFLNHVKIRNSIFSSAKRSGSPSLWTKYRSYHNKTLAYPRYLKYICMNFLIVSLVSD